MQQLDQILNYISAQALNASRDLQDLHNLIWENYPQSKLWFLDGKNKDGKQVSNPNIGYGSCILHSAKGLTREFYQVGLSANTMGISIYIFGIEDKKLLANKYALSIGKAKITAYCIKFKSLKDIHVPTLLDLLEFSFGSTHQ